jgi:hypothetical protein
MAPRSKSKEDVVAEAAAPTAAELVEQRLRQTEIALGAFDVRIRELLILGLPGRELQSRIVDAFDELDGLRASARDTGEPVPYPRVRM